MRLLDSIVVKLLLKCLQEVRHELDVLQEHPMTVIVSLLKVVHGNDVLTVTERDGVHVGQRNIALAGKVLNINNGVGTRRQNEVDRGSRR